MRSLTRHLVLLVRVIPCSDVLQQSSISVFKHFSISVFVYLSIWFLERVCVMRVAIANAKGGVAKTTSAMYLAAACVLRGWSAVVLDADPQSSASLWRDMAEDAGEVVRFEVRAANLSTLTRVSGMEARDWVFVDAPPSGPILERALQVADFVIVPTSDSPIDLQQAWATVAAIPDGVASAVLVVRAEAGTRACAETLEALWRAGTPSFEAVVRKRQDIKKSLGHNPSKLYEYAQVLDEMIEEVAR